MANYQWKINKFPVDAQAAGEELDRIKEAHNGITPEKVVEESVSEEAVLHSCFEWNDDKAAKEYREVQAREIIRNVVIVKTTSEELSEPITIRAYVPIIETALPETEVKIRKYIPVQEAMDDNEYRKQTLKRAFDELKSFQNKYKQFKEFDEVFKAIDDVIVRVEKKGVNPHELRPINGFTISERLCNQVSENVWS